jgi:hypothetical protein
LRLPPLIPPLPATPEVLHKATPCPVDDNLRLKRFKTKEHSRFGRANDLPGIISIRSYLRAALGLVDVACCRWNSTGLLSRSEPPLIQTFIAKPPIEALIGAVLPGPAEVVQRGLDIRSQISDTMPHISRAEPAVVFCAVSSIQLLGIPKTDSFVAYC